MVARFEILRTLGTGGTAVVRLARDTATGRLVALKTLRHLSSEGAGLFAREFRLLAHLDHPGLVRLYELVETADGPTIVMEYLEGPTLQEMLSELRGDEARVRELTAQMAQTLDWLHQHGLVHGDLKPSNVHLLDGARTVIVDFGFSTAIAPALPALGVSPLYWPPEFDPGAPPTVAGDVWGLGGVLHELLSGHPPRPRIRLPAESSMTPFVQRMLAKRPEDRPSLSQLLAELRCVVAPVAVNRTPILGLDAILRQAAEVVASAANLPRMLVLHGAPGVGRSTMARQVLTAAQAAGFRAFSVTASAFDELPFRILDPLAESIGPDASSDDRRALAMLLPGFAARVGHVQEAPGSPGDVPGAFARAMHGHLTAVLVDDAHNADPGSGALLGEAFATLADLGRGALLVATQTSADSPFTRAFARNVARSATVVDHLPLEPLSRADSEALLMALGVERQRVPVLATAAAGNPLLLSILAHEAQTRTAQSGPSPEAPAGGWSGLWDAVGGADPDTGMVLLALAAAQVELPLRVIAELTEQGVERTFDTIMALRRRAVVTTRLRAKTPVAVLSHPQVGSVVRASVTPDAWRRMHLRLAAALSDSAPERLAHYVREGGDLEGSVALLATAAQAASNDARWARAAFLWGKVEETRALAREEQVLFADALSLSGHPVRAAAVFESLAVDEADARARSALYRRAGASLLGAGLEREGLAAMSRVLDASGAKLPSTFLGQLVRVTRSYRDGDHRLQFSARARVPSEAENLQLEALFETAIGVSMWRPFLSAAAQAELLHRSMRLGQATHLARALCIHAIQTAGFRYRPEETKAILAKLYAVCAHVDTRESKLLASAGGAGSAWMEGRVADHVANAVQAVELIDGVAELGSWFRSTVFILHVTGLWARGDIAGMRAVLPRLLRDASTRGDQFLESHLLVHGQCLLDLVEDRPNRALSHLAAALDPWRKLGPTILSVFGGLNEVRAHLAGGDAVAASKSLKEFDRRMRWTPLMSLETHQAVRAEVGALVASAFCRVDHPGADREAKLALARLDKSSHPFCEVSGLALRARVSSRRGDTEDASAKLHAAARHFEVAGAALSAQLVARELGSEDSDTRLRLMGVRNAESLARALVP